MEVTPEDCSADTIQLTKTAGISDPEDALFLLECDKITITGTWNGVPQSREFQIVPYIENNLSTGCRGAVYYAPYTIIEPPISYRYWRLKSTGGGSDGGGISISEWRVEIGGSSTSLEGKTITNLGDAFHLSYPLTNINDGIAETLNADSIAHISGSDVIFDVTVDMTEIVTITSYLIAPQGDSGSAVYHLPTNLTIYGSSNGSDWDQLATYPSISTGLGPWDAGTYREFSTQT